MNSTSTSGVWSERTCRLHTTRSYRTDFLPAQTFDTIACVPESPVPHTMSDYRTLTLLNTHYKIYKRVLVQRLSTILSDISDPSQYCSLWKDTIMDAAAGIHEIVNCVEQTQCAICILSLDFRTAFGNVLHYYLCHVIFAHVFDDTSVKILWVPYINVTSIIDVNGFLSEKFPIECSMWSKTKRHTIVCLTVYIRSLNCAEWEFCHSTWLQGLLPACL